MQVAVNRDFFYDTAKTKSLQCYCKIHLKVMDCKEINIPP